MFGAQFQYEEIRKAVVLFGTLFNDIWIIRADASKFKIPLSYGPQEKFLARINEDPALNRPAAIILPRMGFEITSLTYDGSRKLGTLIKNATANTTSNNALTTQYMWTPYNIGFQLTVMSKTQDDATKIVEQIIPYFRPHWVVKARIDEPFQTSFNIPVVLNTVEQKDTYDDTFTERRAVMWDFNFTMKTFFFGPASQSKVIKIANVNFIVPNRGSDLANLSLIEQFNESESITVQPGLLANGSPTTNALASVGYANIGIDDDYGFAFTINTVDDQA